MLPDEEFTESTVTSLQAQRATLRQQTLFEYGLPTEGSHHERGLPKVQADFEESEQHSLPWGDHVISEEQGDESGIFRVISHNVNGLSSVSEHADVVHMATAMAEKRVSLFGIQETNRNLNDEAWLSCSTGLFGVTVRTITARCHPPKCNGPKITSRVAQLFRSEISGPLVS